MPNDNEGAQANNTPLPPKRAAPVSFKRLLDGAHSYRKCNTVPNEAGDLAIP